MRRQPLLSQRGVTLIEGLVALAIIGIMLLIALPNFRKATVQNRLIGPVRDLTNAADQARLRAINSHGQAVVAFHEGGAGDEFAGEAWAASNAAVVFTDVGTVPADTGNGRWDGASGERLLRSYLLGDFVSFAGPTSADPIQADGWVLGTPAVTSDDRVVFGPSGALASQRAFPLFVYVADRVGNHMRLSFNQITGHVRREKLVPGSSPEVWLGDGDRRNWQWVY